MERIANFIRSILGQARDLRLQPDLIQHELTFGCCRVHPGRRQLFQNGQVVTLNSKAFDLLLIFLQSGGDVLGREELYKRLWGERVVEDANLSQTIYLLRRALDPSGDGRAYVETIPRIGYRFVPPVHKTVPRKRSFGFASAAAALFALTALGLNVHSALPSAAHDADELGEYHLALRGTDHITYALGYFKHAEAIAPGDATAYADAASAYALLAEFWPDGAPHQQQLLARADANVAAALQRDPHFSRAFAVLGFVAYRFHDDDAEATHDLERALALDPNDPQARLWYGVLLFREGNIAGATAQLQEAHRLAPTSEVNARWLARAYAFANEPGPAIAEAQETLRIRPDDAPAMFTIAGAQEQRGHLDAAIATLRALLRRDPYEEPYVTPDVERLEIRLGRADASAARGIGALARTGRADAFETALLYFTIGHRAAAEQMLRRTAISNLAIQRHDPRLLALVSR